MPVHPNTKISASDVEIGMVVDYGQDRITVYGVSDGLDDQVELTDHRGMPTVLRAEDIVTVRGYFNP